MRISDTVLPPPPVVGRGGFPEMLVIGEGRDVVAADAVGPAIIDPAVIEVAPVNDPCHSPAVAARS